MQWKKDSEVVCVLRIWFKWHNEHFRYLLILTAAGVIYSAQPGLPEVRFPPLDPTFLLAAILPDNLLSRTRLWWRLTLFIHILSPVLSIMASSTKLGVVNSNRFAAFDSVAPESLRFVGFGVNPISVDLLLSLFFNQGYFPYRAPKLWQFMIRKPEASSYSILQSLIPIGSRGARPLLSFWRLLAQRSASHRSGAIKQMRNVWSVDQATFGVYAGGLGSMDHTCDIVGIGVQMSIPGNN